MLFWFILGPILLALAAYLLHGKKAHIIIITGQSILFCLTLYTLYKVHHEGTLTSALGNYESWLSINLVADAIGILFVIISCFLFLAMLVFNYHKSYMNHLFLFLFLTLEGLINGIFLSADLFDLFTLIEVSTVVVSVLIMYKKDSQSIYDGMVYLFTNFVAMTFFLFGIGYLYKIFGSMDLATIKTGMSLVKDPRTLILPYTFLITAIGLKSAVMPLFSWLPRAHGTPSAPSIVSAILSGLYVKGGLYLFIRFQSVFGQALDTHDAFLLMGFLTAVIGFTFALSQTDIKLILAYHTVSQIGLIIFGLSMGSDYAYYGGIYHILNHAVFKSTLFLTAGMIIEEYDTRDIRQISGVFKRLPFVSIIMIIAMFGITGAPLFNGSISKYMIGKGTSSSMLLEYGLVFINLGTVVSFVKYSSMFFGKTHEPKKKVRLNQKIAITALAIATFLGGILGQPIVNGLFHMHMEIDFLSYAIKTFIYCMSLLVGMLFYLRIYPRLHFFKTIREVELSFNEIIFTIVFFFGGFLSYLTITI